MHPGQGSPASHGVWAFITESASGIWSPQRVNVDLMAGPCAYDTRFVANHTADDSEGGGCTCAGESHDSSQAGTQLQVHRGGQGRSRGGRARCVGLPARRSHPGVGGWASCQWVGSVPPSIGSTPSRSYAGASIIGTPHDRAIQFAIRL